MQGRVGPGSELQIAALQGQRGHLIFVELSNDKASGAKLTALKKEE